MEEILYLCVALDFLVHYNVHITNIMGDILAALITFVMAQDMLLA